MEASPEVFSLGHLAQLVVTMPGWLTNAVLENELDLGAATGYTYEETETLLQIFDKNVREALPSIYGPTADEPAPGF